MQRPRSLLKWRSYSTRPIIDFEDTKTIFQSRTSPQLLTSYMTLKSCQFPLISKLGPSMLEHGGFLARCVARNTYFDYFCGGESINDPQIANVVNKLHAEGIFAILDYSVEGSPPSDASNPLPFDEARADNICQGVADSIHFSAKQNGKCAFGVVKITGIANTSLLQHISHLLQVDATTLPDFFRLPQDYVPTRTQAFKGKTQALDANELAQLQKVLRRMETLCDACIKANIPLLVDAEQSFFQAAIDRIFLVMAMKYNTPERTIIYNTYQLYLQDSYDRLLSDTQYLQRHGKSMGTKLVRGAYMKTESARSLQLQLPNPVHKTIQNTHAAYNGGVQYCLENTIPVLIASHNQDTVQRAAQWIADHASKLAKNDKRVQFAQLYGMGDSMSLALTRAGFNVSKYVPFGPLQEVMPYLSRRLIENSDIMGGASIELQRMHRELQRRWASPNKQ